MRFSRALLATALLIGAATGGALRGAMTSQAAGGDSSTPPRPFEHRRHESISCRECHGAADEHRTMLVRTARDCAACHHDERRALECAGCHAPAALPQERAVTTTLHVAERTVARVLPFGHDRHRAVECRACHDTPVTLQVRRACESCHENHHRDDAGCSTCHTATAREQHDAASHLSCAGAACHQRRLPARTASRTLCIACHVEQATHEPDASCAACHKIPARARP